MSDKPGLRLESDISNEFPAMAPRANWKASCVFPRHLSGSALSGTTDPKRSPSISSTEDRHRIKYAKVDAIRRGGRQRGHRKGYKVDTGHLIEVTRRA